MLDRRLCSGLFVTFGQGVNVGNTSATFNGAGSGTGFIFVRNGFDFDAFQVDLTSSNNAVAQITSATVLNSTFTFLPYSYRFNVGPGPIEVGAGVGPPNYSPNANKTADDGSGTATPVAVNDAPSPNTGLNISASGIVKKPVGPM